MIGGGFFGCEVALELRRLGFERVLVAEREESLLRRASYVNQARVHNGYHYPRSYATALGSRRNFFRFVDEYGEAVVQSFVKLYAIARGSRVSASQFTAFCAAIGAPCRPVSQSYRHLFDLDLVEEAFLTQEFAFDSLRLAAKLRRELSATGVRVRTGTSGKVLSSSDSSVTLALNGSVETAGWLFNCTYAGLELTGVPIKSRIKKELTEMVLIKPPLPIADVGITVMDGPYFSTMPFPAAGVHSLTHVRYTPHSASDEVGHQPSPPSRSNCDYMIRDAARYVPDLGGARVIRSLFEVKAVLCRNETDDARPILVERSGGNPRIVSILGSKLDNIYDVREYLSKQSWE